MMENKQNHPPKLKRSMTAGQMEMISLGAGKTTLTKGIGRGLGVKRVINSPTFNILKGYQGRIPLYHLDVYRLEGVKQELGFEEYFEGDGVCVIEWAQFIEDELPKERLAITMTHLENGRRLVLMPIGKHYEDIVRRFFDEKLGA